MKVSESKPKLNVAESFAPSARLMQSALSGLLVVGAGACSDTETSDMPAPETKVSDADVEALCKDKVDTAVDKALADQDVKSVCSEMVADAKKAAQSEGELTKLCESMVSSAKGESDKTVSDLKSKVKSLEDQLATANDQVKSLKEKAAPLLLTSDEKTTTSEQKEYTYAELTSMCDQRGGYTQVHGACGGHNACAGFSYGDWGPGAATLTEHTCTGVNGCNGLSCVVLPKDTGRSGKELYEDAMFPEPLGGCGGCHGGYYDDAQKWVKDSAYFALFLLPGSTRTADNWLDRPAREQELVTAFGARGVLSGGTAYQNMGEYHSALSRAEIERVVAHIRTLKPSVHAIKTADSK